MGRRTQVRGDGFVAHMQEASWAPGRRFRGVAQRHAIVVADAKRSPTKTLRYREEGGFLWHPLTPSCEGEPPQWDRTQSASCTPTHQVFVDGKSPWEEMVVTGDA